MGRIVETELRVGWGDCDPAGIVYYPTFFHWFDVATFNYFETIGLPILELQSRYGTLGLPLLEASAKFQSPARPQDKLTVRTSSGALKARTIELRHVILRDAMPLLEGRELRVWAIADASRPKGMRAQAIPPEVRERLDGAQ